MMGSDTVYKGDIPMADVFISYSRKNIDFARSLFEALKRDGRDSWIDWDDISMSTAWWLAIQEGIESANAFVFVITPDSLASPVCTLEVAHAIASNKRIIPVMQVSADMPQIFGRLAAFNPTGYFLEMLSGRDLLTVARANWNVLEAINWISFESLDAFESGVNNLVKVVETDYERVRLHTRLLVRTREWRTKTFDKSYLLVGTDLRDAASWLKVDGDKEPIATEEHKAFIRASLHQEQEDKAARDRQIADFNAASARATAEATRAEAEGKQAQLARRNARLAALVTLVLIVVLGLVTLNANGQITTATDQLNTATRAQGVALNDRSTSFFVQGQAEQRAALADTQVFIGGATLTPIPPTLTQAESERQIAVTQAEYFRQLALETQAILQEFNEVLGLINAGVYVDARGRMERLQALYPDNPIAHSASGNIRAVQGDYTGAIADYGIALNIDPQYADAYLNRGKAYFNLGDPEAAITDFGRALQFSPTSEIAFFSRGVTYASLANPTSALSDLTNAISLNANYTAAYLQRGDVYLVLNNFAAAVVDYRSALRLDPTAAAICSSLNRALARLNQPNDPCAPTPTASVTRGRLNPVIVPTQPPLFVGTPIPFDTPDTGNSSSLSSDASQEAIVPTVYVLPFDTPIPTDNFSTGD